MAVSVLDIDQYQFVLVRLAGDVTLEELYSLDDRLRQSSASYDLFVFSTPDARITASPKSLRDFAAAELVFSSDSRRVIMASDDVMFGMSRMYSLSATPTEEEIKVCKTLAEAAAVLDIPVDELEKFSQPS